jgi:uncharacterized membrane protein (UPF0127 family)
MTRTLALAAIALVAVACSGGEPARSSSREADHAPSETAGAQPSTAAVAEAAPAAEAEQPAPGPTVVLEPPGRDAVIVRAEVARTPAQTQRGLMHRRQLDDDAGMLFLFRRPRQQSFWMRNTYIPLDMIFITSELRVLGVVENAAPETDDPREVEGMSQYVLEVNAGFARRHGIGPGTAVRFEHVEPLEPRAGGPDGDYDEEEDDLGEDD